MRSIATRTASSLLTTVVLSSIPCFVGACSSSSSKTGKKTYISMTEDLKGVFIVK